MKLFNKLFLIIFLSQCTCFNIASSMEKHNKKKITIKLKSGDVKNIELEDENSKRNWRNSLDIKHFPEKIDEFFNKTKEYINIQSSNEIVKENLKLKELSYDNNTCTGKFILLYEKDGKKNMASLNFDTIFVSGKIPIKKEYKYKEKNVQSTYNLFPEKELSNSNIDIQKKQAERINNLILGKEVIQDGTCAEASMIGSLYFSLPDFINDRIGNINEKSNIKIKGTIFLVSSIKDACSKRCIPMFNQLMINMKNLLLNHGIKKLEKNIIFSEKLENLVLIASQEPHLKSRENMKAEYSAILLDFNEPKNRIFSMDIKNK